MLTSSDLLLIESGVDPNLVAQDGFVFSVLDAHFLVLIEAHLHRGLSYVLSIAVKCMHK